MTLPDGLRATVDAREWRRWVHLVLALGASLTGAAVCHALVAWIGGRGVSPVIVAASTGLWSWVVLRLVHRVGSLRSLLWIAPAGGAANAFTVGIVFGLGEDIGAIHAVVASVIGTILTAPLSVPLAFLFALGAAPLLRWEREFERTPSHDGPIRFGSLSATWLTVVAFTCVALVALARPEAPGDLYLFGSQADRTHADALTLTGALLLAFSLCWTLRVLTLDASLGRWLRDVDARRDAAYTLGRAHGANLLPLVAGVAEGEALKRRDVGDGPFRVSDGAPFAHAAGARERIRRRVRASVVLVVFQLVGLVGLAATS